MADVDAWMDAALAEARRAIEHDDVPVGAVVVHRPTGEVVARAHNERELRADPSAHAELLALRAASEVNGSWRLDAHALVVTLEPCPMCGGAAVAGRIARLVYGAADLKGGACGSLYNLCCDPRLNHELAVTGGVRAADCQAQLSGWFEQRRAAN